MSIAYTGNYGVRRICGIKQQTHRARLLEKCGTRARYGRIYARDRYTIHIILFYIIIRVDSPQAFPATVFFPLDNARGRPKCGFWNFRLYLLEDLHVFEHSQWFFSVYHSVMTLLQCPVAIQNTTVFKREHPLFFTTYTVQ